MRRRIRRVGDGERGDLKGREWLIAPRLKAARSGGANASFRHQARDCDVCPPVLVSPPPSGRDAMLNAQLSVVEFA